MSQKTRVSPALRSAGLTQDDRHCERRTKPKYVKLSIPIDNPTSVRSFVAPDGVSKVLYGSSRQISHLAISFPDAIVQFDGSAAELQKPWRSCGVENCAHLLRASVVLATMIKVTANAVNVVYDDIVAEDRHAPGVVGESVPTTLRATRLRCEAAFSEIKRSRKNRA